MEKGLFFIWKAALLMHKKRAEQSGGVGMPRNSSHFFFSSKILLFPKKKFFFLSNIARSRRGLSKKKQLKSVENCFYFTIEASATFLPPPPLKSEARENQTPLSLTKMEI